MHLIGLAIVLIISGSVAGTQTQETQSAPLETEVVQEEPSKEPAKRLTWQDNPKDCDLKTEWIRADNFGCIPIPKSEPTAPKTTISGNKEDWMRQVGIPESDWTYVDYIISHESGWNPCAYYPGQSDCNATPTTACGIPQALPCSKLGPNWSDPIHGLTWAHNYALERYGSWANAYAFWLSNSWW